MNMKSIMYSFLSLILYVAILVGTIFLFKVHYMFILLGVGLLIIPFKIQRLAISNASGKIDNFICKYLVSTLLLIAILFVVLYFTLWI